ncbi:hypothetical protein DITRI_Ditri03aG0174400 [Diplodiscus trichospermus]
MDLSLKDLGKTIMGSSSITDWRSLFSAAADQSLQFFPPQLVNGKLLVSPPAEVFKEGEYQWRNAIVVQFVGKISNFSIFQKLVNTVWVDSGKVDIRPAGTNLFIVQFPNEESRDRVLETSPWHIQNKPLIVRKWEPGLKSLDFNMYKLPVWVHLSNIPHELFTQSGISYVASALGNPLYRDRFTASEQRLAFAKVCIEIEASKDIPQAINVELRNGTIVQIYVDVPWMPMKCSHCAIFGHGDKTCTKKPVMVKARVPK